MKKYFNLIIIVFCCSCANSQTETVVNHQDFEKYNLSGAQADSVFKSAKKFANETQLSIALIENGVARFYGVHLSNDSLRSSENHQNVFEIGSISKVFTATLLAGLVLDEKITSLDDNIDSYLDFPFKDNQKLTFKNLANHTSGLPRLPTNLMLSFENRNNPYADYDEVKLITYLTDSLTLTQKDTVAYSNLGVGLLGYTLSKIANSSYQDLLQSRITSKYEMNHTTVLRSDIKDLLVKGRNGGTIVPNWDLAVLEGAGGILSNVEDLSKFAIAQFDTQNKELELTRTKTVSVNKNMNIGLGWFLQKADYGDNLYFHNGGTGGYTSSMIIDADNKNGVIILSNVSAFSQKSGAIDKLSSSLMRTLQKQ